MRFQFQELVANCSIYKKQTPLSGWRLYSWWLDVAADRNHGRLGRFSLGCRAELLLICRSNTALQCFIGPHVSVVLIKSS